jgi:hypothetical protein
MTSPFKLGSLRAATAGLALGLSVFNAAYSILYCCRFVFNRKTQHAIISTR